MKLQDEDDLSFFVIPLSSVGYYILFIKLLIMYIYTIVFVIMALMAWITLAVSSGKIVHYPYSIMEKPAPGVDNWRAGVDNFEGVLYRSIDWTAVPVTIHNQGWLVHQSRQSYPHQARVINGKPGVINDFTLTHRPALP